MSTDDDNSVFPLSPFGTALPEGEPRARRNVGGLLDKSEFSLWLNQTPDEREAFAIEKRNIWKFAYKGDSLKRHYMGYFSKPARAWELA